MKGYVKASTPQRPPVGTTEASAAAMLCRPLAVNTSCSGATDHTSCDKYVAATLRTAGVPTLVACHSESNYNRVLIACYKLCDLERTAAKLA